MKRLLKGLIRLYQLTLAPWLGSPCRFEPSCSRYATEALDLHGPIRGTLYTIWRLARCQPFAKSGADPVPPAPTRSTQTHQMK